MSNRCFFGYCSFTNSALYHPIGFVSVLYWPLKLCIIVSVTGFIQWNFALICQTFSKCWNFNENLLIDIFITPPHHVKNCQNGEWFRFYISNLIHKIPIVFYQILVKPQIVKLSMKNLGFIENGRASKKDGRLLSNYFRAGFVDHLNAVELIITFF